MDVLRPKLQGQAGKVSYIRVNKQNTRSSILSKIPGSSTSWRTNPAYFHRGQSLRDSFGGTEREVWEGHPVLIGTSAGIRRIGFES